MLTRNPRRHARRSQHTTQDDAPVGEDERTHKSTQVAQGASGDSRASSKQASGGRQLVQRLCRPLFLAWPQKTHKRIQQPRGFQSNPVDKINQQQMSTTGHVGAPTKTNTAPAPRTCRCGGWRHGRGEVGALERRSGCNEREVSWLKVCEEALDQACRSEERGVRTPTTPTRLQRGTHLVDRTNLAVQIGEQATSSKGWRQTRSA